ncbi:MAG: cbb3-type cytochrome c oxidase N-terminal domain-containing protein [Ferruginibacter sp.]
MLFFKSIKNKTTLTVLSVFSALTLSAQTKAPVAVQAATSGYNQLAVLLIILIIVLAFVIWGMGQVLTALGRQLLDKNKNTTRILSIVLLAGFSMLSQISFAEDATANTIKEIPNYGGLTESAYYVFLTVFFVELAVILFLAFSIRRMYTELLPEKVKPKSEGSKLATWWTKMDSKLFTRAVAVEKEADILLDHDYDGIKELDNALPPWWKYGFYITIGIAFIYLLNFHVFGTGLNPTQEYDAEMEHARIEKEVYEATNKDKIDEKNVPLANAEGIKAGQNLFEANCVACHLKDGGGIVGPNLTDNYWLHKGSLNDIYNTIKNGYPDKGMQPWGSMFSPKEISFIASFVKSLKGSKPATPKDPQGEFYVDEVIVSDSAAVAKPDSAGIKK